MIVSISQPTLFPWLGYFDIIKNSDIFVFFDNVKFEKRSWQMRNKLKMISQKDETYTWINIPTINITQKTLIKDALIDNTKKWKSIHMNMFHSHYGKDVDDVKFLLELYKKDWKKISDFNIEFIKNCCSFLGINTKIFNASSLEVEGKRSQLLLNICKKLNATEYLSGPAAKVYLDDDKEIFEDEEIKILYHDYKHPVYKQRGKIFVEKLSILDLLFNEKRNSMKYFIDQI
jgi:hypothetical protein